MEMLALLPGSSSVSDQGKNYESVNQRNSRDSCEDGNLNVGSGNYKCSCDNVSCDR